MVLFLKDSKNIFNKNLKNIYLSNSSNSLQDFEGLNVDPDSGFYINLKKYHQKGVVVLKIDDSGVDNIDFKNLKLNKSGVLIFDSLSLSDHNIMFLVARRLDLNENII